MDNVVKQGMCINQLTDCLYGLFASHIHLKADNVQNCTSTKYF